MILGLTPRRATLRMDPALAIVNVVLLLIFFFLVSGQEGRVFAELDLPDSRSLPAGQLPSPVLEVLPSGQWRLDGVMVQPALLAAALPPGDAPLHVVMDREAPSARLFELLSRPELSERPLRLVTERRVGE